MERALDSGWHATACSFAACLGCHCTGPYRVWSWWLLSVLLIPRQGRVGPVRFDLEFESERLSFAGHGLIRWAEPDERLLGVEISDIDEPLSGVGFWADRS